jgi:hypothetical protein
MRLRARERAIALCSVQECARIHLEAYDRALAYRRARRRSILLRARARPDVKP